MQWVPSCSVQPDLRCKENKRTVFRLNRSPGEALHQPLLSLGGLCHNLATSGGARAHIVSSRNLAAALSEWEPKTPEFQAVVLHSTKDKNGYEPKYEVGPPMRDTKAVAGFSIVYFYFALFLPLTANIKVVFSCTLKLTYRCASYVLERLRKLGGTVDMKRLCCHILGTCPTH